MDDTATEILSEFRKHDLIYDFATFRCNFVSTPCQNVDTSTVSLWYLILQLHFKIRVKKIFVFLAAFVDFLS